MGFCYNIESGGQMQKEVISGKFNFPGGLTNLPDGKYEITIYQYEDKALGINERCVEVVNLDPTLQMLHKQYGI